MSEIASNNKRIAKNTILLYCRMLFLMIVTLYTSRVTLAALGVEDYGIYNVVGGIVVMASFFRNTMSGATQRFLSFAIGEKNIKKLEDCFKTCLYLHIIISVLIVVVVETVGVWFLNSHLNIPDNRLSAANYVLQFSLFTYILTTLSVSYNADIIAHEKMGAFAYFSIIEAVGKLLIAFLIEKGSFDRLILYSLLILILSACLQICYVIYCKKHFFEAKFCVSYNKSMLKDMTGYVSWSFYSNIAGIFYGQGVNILLNIFFNPVLNAARGIAYQVQHAILQFTTNFQMAVNPQIIKYYASKNLPEMFLLMQRSSRFSFFVMLYLCLPLFLTADIVLGLWLKNVPDYSVEFCRLVLIISLIDTVSNPLTTATQATGKLKLNAILGGTNLLLIVPFSYLFLKLGLSPSVVFYVNIFFSVTGLVIRLYVNKKLLGFPIINFFMKVFLRGWTLAAISAILPFYANTILPRNIETILIIVLISLITISVSVYLFDLSREEKGIISNVFKKIKSKV